MNNKYIYVREGFNIEKYKLSFDEKKVLSMIKKLDDYYDNRGILRIFVGVYPNSVKPGINVIEIQTLKRYCELDASLNQICEYMYYDFEPIRLSKIIRRFCCTKNKIELSAIVDELLDFNPDSSIETELYKEVLDCIKFEVSKNKLDFQKNLLNIEYKSDINELDYYYIDQNSFSEKINSLPSSSKIHKKNIDKG